ncbi:MAG: ATP-binding protein, partial [Alphaproteobacteria bacterium]
MKRAQNSPRAAGTATRSLFERLNERTDSEHEQALVRIGIGVFIMAYLITLGLIYGFANPAVQYPKFIAIGGIAIAIAVFWHICRSPAVNPARRVFANVIDNLSLSIFLYFGGELTAPFYAVYLWFTFGCGFRYGNRYLAISTVLSLVGFGTVVLFTPFWAEMPGLSAGMLVALIALPAYVSTLIKKLTEAKAEAEAASRAKSRFLATISHELRTPLNSIIGLGGLMRDTHLDAEQRALTRSIKSSARTLLSLINNILDFSRFETGRITVTREPFDIYSLFAEIDSMFVMQARAKGLFFGTHVSSRVPQHLKNDARHLRDIIVNLVGNGVKFTEFGKVVIDVDAEHATDGKVLLKIAVSDTGIGISEGQRTKIFESFYQADDSITRRFGGTGLGLAIVKQLVEAIGGTIAVDSEVGKGSRFVLRVPADLPMAEEMPAVQHLSADRVFLLSRERRTADVVMRAALRLGTQVKICAGAMALIEAIRADGDHLTRPIVLFDTENGEVTGPAFAALLRRHAAGSEPVMVQVRPADQAVGRTFEAEMLDFSYATTIDQPIAVDTVARALLIAHSVAVAGGADEELSGAELASLRRGRALDILIAEDNPVNRRVIAQILERAGHRPILVENGEKALKAMEDSRFDLVLLDLNMPEMS